MENDEYKSEATIKIPFENERHAEIACKVLSVDKEPRRNFVVKVFNVEGLLLTVEFKATTPKSLRSSINSFFEHLLLCQETIKRFDVIAQQQNAGAYTCTNTA